MLLSRYCHSHVNVSGSLFYTLESSSVCLFNSKCRCGGHIPSHSQAELPGAHAHGCWPSALQLDDDGPSTLRRWHPEGLEERQRDHGGQERKETLGICVFLPWSYYLFRLTVNRSSSFPGAEFFLDFSKKDSSSPVIT